MSERDDGGPVFPVRIDDGDGSFTQMFGATLRDYFMTHAPASEIEGLMPDTVDELAKWLGLTDKYYFRRDYPRCISKARGIWADAMLAERTKP